MSDSVFVGTKAGGLETSPQFEPISKIILLVDNENYYEAGNDTGRALEITCPYGTQAMANNLLSSLGGYAYQPATATDALIDPAAELGDAVTVGGVYTVLAQMDTTFDSLMTADIGAPGQEEIESEYPYVSQQQSDINRQLANTRSEIAKNSEQIQLTVEGLNSANQAISQLTLSLDSIELSVSNGSTSSTITLKKDNAVISSQKITMSGLVTFAGLANGTTTIDGGCIKTGTIDADRIDADNLYVNAANITGSLTVGQLPSNVATDSDIPTRTSDLTNDSGYQTRSGVVSIIDGTVTADYVEALEVAAATLRGRTIYIQNNSGSRVGYISTSSADSGGSAIDINSYGAGRFVASGNLYFSGRGTVLELVSNYIGCGRTLRPASTSCDLGTSGWLWGDIYATNGTINTSDRNRKTDISYDMSRYEAMFDALKPANFKMIDGTSGRTHTGFISQDIEDALAPCGLTSIDFATFIKSPKVDEDGKVIEGEYVYGLRYDELIALMVAQIQSLKKRVADLEVAHGQD